MPTVASFYSGAGGFDAGMEFCGPITAQYRQIGNSVAPPVAKAIATYIKENNYV